MDNRVRVALFRVHDCSGSLYAENKRTTRKKTPAERRTRSQRFLDAASLPEKVPHPRPVVLVVDVTYFGREYGVLVARNPNEKENLYVAELRHETKLEYTLLKKNIESLGHVIIFVRIGRVP